MTTFEEQFPSLHEAETTGEGVWIGDDGTDKVFKNQYSENDIMNYCLDKQKVREAINKHLSCEDHNNCALGDMLPCTLNIFRELGL